MTNTKKQLISNRKYDISKNLVQLWLPAAGTFYATIGNSWGLPATDAVVTTILAVSTFLGVVLGVSRKVYDPYSGAIEARVDSDGNVQYTIETDDDPYNMQFQENVNFKVNRTSQD